MDSAKEKKKFKDTKVGKWLKLNAPDILSAIGDFYPPVKLLSGLVAGRSDIEEPDKAEFEQYLKEYETELRYHTENTAGARRIYKNSKDITDRLARNIMFINLPIIMVLVVVNIMCIKWLDSTLLAVVSNVIGMTMQKLFEERSVVTNFFFGSSKGSKDKENLFNTK